MKMILTLAAAMQCRRWVQVLCIAASMQGMAESAKANDSEDCLKNGYPLMQSGQAARVFNACKRLSDQGNADAQFNVAGMLMGGVGTPQDKSLGVKYLRESADGGAASAQAFLGVLYIFGENGIPKDPTLGVSWLRKAAEQDLGMGQYALANAYANGWGVPLDHTQAYMWFNIAASRAYPGASEGYGDSAKQRDLLAQKMSPDQIARAQELSSDWVKKHRKDATP